MLSSNACLFIHQSFPSVFDQPFSSYPLHFIVLAAVKSQEKAIATVEIGTVQKCGKMKFHDIAM